MAAQMYSSIKAKVLERTKISILLPGTSARTQSLETRGRADPFVQSRLVEHYPPTINILATFAEFESDLIRLRTREGMKIARAKGRLKGKQPKLSDRQQKELGRMHGTGQYTISDLAELFSISRPTVYRTLRRTGNRA
jgi:hypothetical protein